MKFNEKHFFEFEKMINQKYAPWPGKAPERWGRWILENYPNILDVNILQELSNDSKKRECLYADCKNMEISDLGLAISILAWGGMNMKHGARVLQKEHLGWLDIIRESRQGNLSRTEAYEKFYNLRHSKNLPGMGLAYFTKIIFFSAPKLDDHKKSDGYIMDQWTARSINLLLDMELVKLVKSASRKNGDKIYTVSDKNDKNVYENFCLAIEILADRLELSPAVVEEKLFSTGKGKGDWRKYVIAQIS